MNVEPPIEITPRQLELLRQYQPGVYRDALDLQKTGDVIVKPGAGSCKA